MKTYYKLIMYKKTLIKSTLVVCTVAISCLGAWRAYGSYGDVDNSLLMENLEALAQAEGGDASGDTGVNFNGECPECIVKGESMRSVACLETVTSSSGSAGVGDNGGGVVYTSTNSYYNKYKLVCQSDCYGHSCDRREQTDCDGNKLGYNISVPHP